MRLFGLWNLFTFCSILFRLPSRVKSKLRKRRVTKQSRLFKADSEKSRVTDISIMRLRLFATFVKITHVTPNIHMGLQKDIIALEALKHLRDSRELCDVVSVTFHISTSTNNRHRVATAFLSFEPLIVCTVKVFLAKHDSKLTSYGKITCEPPADE
jgi:hypothetical protein